MIRAQQAPTVSPTSKASSPSMTVPAFSLSVVLPGAPSATAGVGAPGTGGIGGLFEGLLAGLADANAGDPARPARGLPSDAAPSTDEDATPAPQDAGLALLLAAPGAAPVLTPLPPPVEGATAADVLAARQIRLPAAGLADAALAGDDVAAAPLADPAPAVPRFADALKSLVGQTGQTVPAVDVKATAPAAAAPRAEAARPVVATAAPPPPQPVAVAPPVQAAPVTAAPVIAAAVVAEAQVTPDTPRPTPTIGDIRRAGPARGDRRADPAGRALPAGQADASPVKQVALAALAEAIDATPTDAAAPADPEAPVGDVTDAPEATQPNLPGEARAQAAQALVTAEAAPVPRGSPETVAKLAADIIRKLDGQSTRFDLELNPHGMGKVDVAIEIDRAGKLTAAMTFDTAQSAADLRGRATELRQALEQAGFSVSDGGLTFDMAGQGAGFGGRDAAQHQQDRAWNGRAFQRAQSGADEADLSLAGASPLSASRTRSGVDIRI